MWLSIFIFTTIVAVFFILDADPVTYFLPSPSHEVFMKGKVVWITGASSGIGASLAIDMARAGATLVISARRVGMLEQVARNCKDVLPEGIVEPIVLPLDVTDVEAQKNAVHLVMERLGRIDTLVLNAGKSQRNTGVETPLSVTEDIMKLNFLSVVSLTTLVLPHMLQRKQGQLAVMSSVSGVLGTPVASSYSASKFALVIQLLQTVKPQQ